MKKFLTSTIVLALVAALLGVFVACGNTADTGAKDAETAKNAITSVRNLYEGKSQETPDSYSVTGVVNVNQTIYNVVWTIESDSAYKSNVTVGEREGNTVTIVVTKASEVINYKLVATVTVGKAKETFSFDRYVPASSVQNPDEKEVSIDLTGKTNRTVFTADQQVWTQNGITLTNDKASSVTNISQGDSDYHARLYKDSNVKIEYPSMIRIIFYSDNTYDYHAQLIESLEKSTLGTVTSDTENATATLALNAPADEIEFAAAKQMRLTRIDVIAGKTALTDEQKVASAISALDLDTKNFIGTGEYDLPAEKNGLAVTWAVKETSDYVTIAGGKLNISSMPTAETEVVLVATVTSGSASDDKEITIKLVPVAGVTNDGTQEHPYTPSEAKKVIAATLAENATSTDEYYVKGYVIAPGTYSSQYDNFDDMYIADAADNVTADAAAFLVYRPKPDGTYLTADGFTKGDLVTFKGKFQNYKSSSSDTLTPELVSATCVAREAAQRTDAQIVADAKETLSLTKTKFTAANEEMDLPTSKSGATISWAVKGTSELVTVTDNKLTIVSVPATSTTVTLTATFTSNSASDTKDYEITVEPLQTVHAGTQGDPFTIADVKAIGTTLANSGYYGGATAQLVYVTGYIVEIGTWSDQYNNYTGVYLVDEYSADKDKDSADAVQLYRLAKDSQFVTGSGAIAKGDCITVKGYIQVYSNKVQVTYNGSTNPTAVDLIKAGVTRTDAEIVAAAKAAATLAASYEAGEVTLSTTSNGATLAWEVISGECVTINGATMTITAPDAQTTVTVKVTITKGDASDTKEFTFTVLAASTKGSENDPYTVAELDAIFATLTDGQTYQVGGEDKLVYVRGYVVAEGTDGNYGREDVKIADSADAADGVLIYGHNYDGNLAKGQGLDVGDKVLVCGYLKLYGTTKEIANSATRPVIKIEQKVEMTDERKVAKALAAVSATLANITKTGEVALSTTTTVEGVTLAWSTEDATYTVTDNKLNVAELPTTDTTVTLTLTATCNEVSDTKTVTVVIKAPITDPGQSFTGTISFANTDARVSQDTSGQVWEADGITFTNNKASSTSNVIDSSNPVRCYASSSIKIECAAMNKITFVCNSASYATALQSSIGTQEGVTVVVSGSTVTVTFSETRTEFSIAKLTAQVRINSITVENVVA